MRKLILGIIPALVIGAAAFAANTTFFTSIGDLVFPFSPPRADGSAGTIDNMTIGAETPRAGSFTTVTADQVNSALGSYAANPASSTYYPAYTMTAGQTQLVFSGGSTVAYAYVTLPASPKNGQQSCIFSQAAITLLYVYGQVGQTVANGATSLSAATRQCYIYSLSNTTWYRSQ